MNQNPNDILAGLRDIHGATAPGWWPPAPGWWLLAVLALGLLLLLLRRLVRWWTSRRRRQRYLEALNRIDRTIDPLDRPGEYLAAVNRLLRAVAVRAFPRNDVARLHGQDWVRFIRGMLPGPAEAGGLDALAAGPYQVRPGFDAASLRAIARRWVQRYG